VLKFNARALIPRTFPVTPAKTARNQLPIIMIGLTLSTTMKVLTVPGGILRRTNIQFIQTQKPVFLRSLIAILG
jgi:hypothetical protein